MSEAMKEKNLSKWNFRTLAAYAAIGWTCLGAANACRAQAAPSDLTPDVQEVLTLSRQNMDDSVITNYITSTGKTYRLSADDIIYLKNQGVSQGVISVLLQSGANGASATPTPAPAASAPTTVDSTPAPIPQPVPDASAPAPVSAPPPVDSGATASVTPAPDVVAPPTPTMDYFQQQLAPYGNWINLPAYGQCWQPAVTGNWRPYYDGGHWEYTDAGWYWQSDYPWGDIAFHYGRWTYTTIGWVWVPGFEYAPSWVVWRHDDADNYVGWAPLPPGAVFVNGGWMYRGVRVDAGTGFGLTVSYFTFVGYDHFWEHDYRRFIVPHDRVVLAFGHSAIENHYAFNHGFFVNVGIPRARMVVYTHTDFHPVLIGGLRTQEEQRNILLRRDDIHNYNPGVSHPDAMGGWGRHDNGHNGWGH
jgi:hypothetical protein